MSRKNVLGVVDEVKRFQHELSSWVASKQKSPPCHPIEIELYFKTSLCIGITKWVVCPRSVPSASPFSCADVSRTRWKHGRLHNSPLAKAERSCSLGALGFVQNFRPTGWLQSGSFVARSIRNLLGVLAKWGLNRDDSTFWVVGHKPPVLWRQISASSSSNSLTISTNRYFRFVVLMFYWSFHKTKLKKKLRSKKRKGIIK